MTETLAYVTLLVKYHRKDIFVVFNGNNFSCSVALIPWEIGWRSCLVQIY